MVVDATAFARCFFDRPSACEQTSNEEEEEFARILADVNALKKMATDYLQPELPVVMDPTAFGRNYFTRFSAKDQEDYDAAEEQGRILEDAKALKKLAVDYLHPEKPVITSDPFATGRNYFTRPSAEVIDEEEQQERDLILEEMQQLKKLAVDYLHPEKPVKTTDPFATGRNFFSRPGAFREEETEEREVILKEMQQLKKLAVDYLHPENPVFTTDPFACGRNYFTRASAVEYEAEDDMDERLDILEDMKELKRIAQDYLQPERPIEIDPLASCRNYFSRPSAEGIDAEVEERARILDEMRQLKKLAIDYLQPEVPVVTSDPYAMGRNYFSRPSAEGVEDVDQKERERIIEDSENLKKIAADFLHPELPVRTTDPFACGRNYFTRPSASEYEEESEVRDMVMQDMKHLKKLAVDFLHPELPVKNDPSGISMARNYFLRASAPEVESEDEARAAMEVAKDCLRLKHFALDYLHPERPVETSDSSVSGRNYFNRPSAPGHAEQIHTQGEAIEQGYNESHMVYHQHVHHYEDHDHDDAHSQSDHFEMDEDVFHVFRESLVANEPFKGEHIMEGDEEEEGKLSRSPSSVMLFAGEAM